MSDHDRNTHTHTQITNHLKTFALGKICEKYSLTNGYVGSNLNKIWIFSTFFFIIIPWTRPHFHPCSQSPAPKTYCYGNSEDSFEMFGRWKAELRL